MQNEPNQVINDLSGKLLIATPHLMSGNIFYKSLIYLLSHTKNGAAGFIVNYLITKMPMQILANMIVPEQMTLQKEAFKVDEALSVYLGGPVELEKGFLIHSNDYEEGVLSHSTKNKIAISSSIGILNDIISGNGPLRSLFTVGYTAWGPGQLEEELMQNLWLVHEPDLDIIFSDINENKWTTALGKMGIDDKLFAPQTGHG